MTTAKFPLPSSRPILYRFSTSDCKHPEGCEYAPRSEHRGTRGTHIVRCMLSNNIPGVTVADGATHCLAHPYSYPYMPSRLCRHGARDITHDDARDGYAKRIGFRVRSHALSWHGSRPPACTSKWRLPWHDEGCKGGPRHEIQGRVVPRPLALRPRAPQALRCW